MLPLAAPAVVTLNVDTAPNAYGSPDWTPWWDAAKSDAAAGSFVDMRSGAYAGTHRMTPYEEIVYSTGDLGQRLHWIYWLPGESTTSLDGRFQVKWAFDWNGVDYTYDWSGGSYLLDDPAAGWTQPSSWEDYDADGDGTDDGVIGTFGFAFWATDNEAAPLDTDGNAYNETDQADIDALAGDVREFQTYAVGQTRYRAGLDADWQAGASIEVQVVPAPAPLMLVSAGLLGLGLAGRRSAAGTRGA
ncbi:hypothetical protein DEM34_11180 [Spiribacter halobius]|uniref:PEP-CTERM protein-sorting domain-containing protein n=2 Tax=Sediminicurvatus halobius TaxID=2182432 RepID=A0A2U2N0J5_9GAMM|nr:hypothetical protein DEM34_11180 [Spiribacter halobius]